MKHNRLMHSVGLLALVAAGLGLMAMGGCDKGSNSPGNGDNGGGGDAGKKGSSAAAQVPKGWVAYKLDLPAPRFEGTPKEPPPNVRLRKDEDAATAFNGPPGVKNVALKKHVTSSDKEPIIGNIPLITDGDKQAMDGSYVEFGPGKQWVQIDLGAKCNIYAIAVWHYHLEARVYRDVIVQVADDQDFIENVQTVFNNDYDNTSGEGVGEDLEYFETNKGELIDIAKRRTAQGLTPPYVVGRFVRLYTKGSTSDDVNHYTEVEVYGVPSQ